MSEYDPILYGHTPIRRMTITEWNEEQEKSNAEFRKQRADWCKLDRLLTPIETTATEIPKELTHERRSDRPADRGDDS